MIKIGDKVVIKPTNLLLGFFDNAAGEIVYISEGVYKVKLLQNTSTFFKIGSVTYWVVENLRIPLCPEHLRNMQ